MNKYFLTPLVKRFSTLFVSKNKVNEWVKNWQFFFILGVGRSGTSFLSHFLNQAERTYVFHEPVFEDFYAHTRAHYSYNAAKTYIEGFRKKEIYLRMRNITHGIYGEVTATLRCHAGALLNAFPGVTLLHLVRDGRDVVRSAMPRRTMTIRNPFSLMIHPVDSDPWKSRWAGMDRFARICWYWQEENKRLRANIGKTIKFENIISDYEYFSTEVLQPCGIHIEKSVWESAVNQPRNTTSEFTMPKWDKWTPEQQKTFIEICGEEMAACGYKI